jgi:hypothetical protein
MSATGAGRLHTAVQFVQKMIGQSQTSFKAYRGDGPKAFERVVTAERGDRPSFSPYALNTPRGVGFRDTSAYRPASTRRWTIA